MNLFSKIKEFYSNKSVQDQGFSKNIEDDISNDSNSPQYLQIYSKYKKSYNKRLILIVTVGRSGSRWLAEIFNFHDRITGSCERDNYAEQFFKYVKWNELPIDLTGVYHKLAHSILNDWKNADLCVLATPPLSMDFLEVCQVLEVDEVIWAVTDAFFTITSLYNKGMYENSICIQDPHLALGYQSSYNDKLPRLFARSIPRGDFYYTWEKLTRIGKISWYYNMFNMRIHEQMKAIGSDRKWIFKLEEADQNFDYYLKLVERFNLAPILTKRSFLSIKGRFVNSKENERKEWNPQELEEFEQYSKEFLDIYPNLSN